MLFCQYQPPPVVPNRLPLNMTTKIVFFSVVNEKKNIKSHIYLYTIALKVPLNYYP